MDGRPVEGMFGMNSAYPEDGFWWDSQLRITPGFQAGVHFLEPYAQAVADLDASFSPGVVPPHPVTSGRYVKITRISTTPVTPLFDIGLPTTILESIISSPFDLIGFNMVTTVNSINTVIVIRSYCTQQIEAGNTGKVRLARSGGNL